MAQDYSTLKDLPLTDAKTCEAAQAKVLECCNALLNNPCVENLNDLNAIQFIMRWMESTPDFSFSFETQFFTSLKGNLGLSSRYLASMAKVALENNYKTNSVELQSKAIEIVLTYAENPNNQVKITKKIKKYIDAKNNGTLPGLIKVP